MELRSDTTDLSNLAESLLSLQNNDCSLSYARTAQRVLQLLPILFAEGRETPSNRVFCHTLFNHSKKESYEEATFCLTFLNHLHDMEKIDFTNSFFKLQGEMVAQPVVGSWPKCEFTSKGFSDN